MSIAPSEWDAFFDGSADVATRARIDSALVSDAAVRQAYLEQARFHWQVGSALRHFQGTIDGGGSTGGGPLAGPWFWAGGTTLLLALVMAWLSDYWLATPGVELADNTTVRLDLDKDPQPDACLFIDEGRCCINIVS